MVVLTPDGDSISADERLDCGSGGRYERDYSSHGSHIVTILFPTGLASPMGVYQYRVRSSIPSYAIGAPNHQHEDYLEDNTKKARYSQLCYCITVSREV